ncbi:MAG: hypothetical protein GYA77_00090 [Candidatus Cloacimonetes bacterium]|jgi:hypothetical protein|nr:hypothetical protein [Candidatus Cloacimonadota bacterium]
MRAIPVDPPQLVTIVNLPEDMARNPLWTEHAPLVVRQMAGICQEDCFQAACSDALAGDEPEYVAFRYGYAFLMLASVLEFLNLKTIGEGIVKSIGLDQSATELLTGSEIDAFKANLERRALEAMKAYLNEAGLALLDELKPRQARVIRAGVI